MASLPILTALAVETQGDQNTIVLTVKGTPKVPESVSVEGAGRGLKTIKVDQADEDSVYAVGAAVRIEGEVEVAEEDGDYLAWFRDNFVPTSNGGAYEAAENGAAEEPAEATTEEESFTATEDEPEETPVATKKSKSKPAAKAKPAAKPAAVQQAKAETKAAAKGKAAAATKKVAAPKATKAPKAPREQKPERTEYNTEDIDTALVSFAKEHGIRNTHVIVKRSLQLLQENGSGKVIMGEAPAESKTIGVIPGQTYEVQKEHKQYGTCDYKVQVQKDKSIKLVAFKGNDGGRKLKVGTVYPHAKALLKHVLQLPDPHVSFYKFFNL